jgi:hypothetical protein
MVSAGRGGKFWHWDNYHVVVGKYAPPGKPALHLVLCLGCWNRRVRDGPPPPGFKGGAQGFKDPASEDAAPSSGDGKKKKILNLLQKD